MTQKIYLAKSVVSIRVSLDYGSTAQVSFEPLVNGGSRFVTTDMTLQDALERHSSYGKLFTLDSTAIVSKPYTYPRPSYSDKEVEGVNMFIPQSFTEQEKSIARENIGAATEPTELANVLKFSEQNLSESQKTQARKNIGVDDMTLATVITDEEMDSILTQ